jgi:hypothetical protein
MRACEFVVENASAGATGSGSVATMAMPLGGMISRSSGSLLSGKYTTESDPTPNTPREYKRNKNARGQFKNSISN